MVFVVGAVVIRIIKKLTARALEKSHLEKGLQSFIRSFEKVGLWIFVILIIADTLGIPSATLVAALSVVGLALSLSLQNILENVFSGFTILFTKPFVSGDYVELGSTAGQVTSINLFYTVLLNFDNKKIFIPNGEVVSSNVINWNDEPIRRISLNFELSYEWPTEKVREALLGAAKADVRVLSDPAPVVRLLAYKSSNIEYSLAVWSKNADYWDVYYGLNESVREYLTSAGLYMSYDHVDVRIIDK